MAKTREKSKKARGLRRGSIAEGVLRELYDLAGDALSTFLDPLQTCNRGESFTEWTREQVQKALTNLKRKKLVKERHKRIIAEAGKNLKAWRKQTKTLYALTEEGIQEIKRLIVKEKIARKKPDGKWRVVIYDIPEDEHHLRNSFRSLLKELGFKMLQASVWAHHKDVFDELELLIPDVKKHDWIKLLVVDVIVGERSFVKLFK